jgi:hypothetical protein
MLQHLPVPRHHLERLGHVFAELTEPGRPAAGASGRAGDEDPLSRQVLGERLARWCFTREGPYRRGRYLVSELVLGRARLEFLQLELHLIEQAGAAFATLAEELAAHLLDRKPQMQDHRLGAGLPRLGLHEVGLRPRKLRLARQHKALQRRDVVGQGGTGDGHAHRRADSRPRQATWPVDRAIVSHPAAAGRQVRWGWRQSIPSSR